MGRGKSLGAALLLTLGLTGCGGGGSGGADGGTPAPPTPPPSTGPSQAELNAAAKFLDRTTFGADFAAIDSAARQGLELWLDEQFALAPSYHEPIVDRYLAEYGFNIGGDPPPGTFRRFAFWERAFTAPDQLRQLTAYALSQIFVVSDNVDALFIDPRGLSDYTDTLLTHAFGNYRDLLRAVTLHPVMGIYLSHVNNARANPAANTFPDENYAREVMQLFSIGLYELNADGSRRLDGNGEPIPSYDNDDIREFAKIFTGLSYGPRQPGGASFFGNDDPVLNVPMVMFEDFHEPGEKRLLRGAVVPAGQSGLEDIDAAIDNLFNHPNVGPFIGRQLIQRLVTSNPSPAYVARVSAAFDGEGGAPRGDLARTLRAVLTDPEADAGIRLREPFRRYVAMQRALGVTSDDGTFPGYGYVVQFLTGQHPLAAASVFNFYSPEFQPAGELGDLGLVAPEFQITTDSTVVGLTNLMAFALYGDVSLDSPEALAAIRLDLTDWEALAGDALIDRIDLLFFQGTMSDVTRNVLTDAVAPLAGDAVNRTRVALYLALSSPDYAVAG